jgi:hypothetical protein
MLFTLLRLDAGRTGAVGGGSGKVLIADGG